MDYNNNQEDMLVLFLEERLLRKKGESFLKGVTFVTTKVKKHPEKVRVEAYHAGKLIASANVDRYGNYCYNSHE